MGNERPVLSRPSFLFLNEAPVQHFSLALIFLCLNTPRRVSPCRYEIVKKKFQNFLAVGVINSERVLTFSLSLS